MSSGAACTTCGAALPVATAKFCMECGSPQAAPAAPPEVRKTVTLLFTDVTGSTSLGEALDPEALRGVMGRYFEIARTAVERHGGVVEKFVGDAVLAVFGVPEVREDDAVRAVRAAADLQVAMADLVEDLAVHQGVRLAIRTGINTGPVVTGADRAGGSFATGDAVNTAARLEQAAGPGEVLLGRSTYDLVRDAVEVVEVEPLELKGKAEPVRAYRLVSVDAAAAGRTRRHDAALVGREREARALEDAFERTVELGRGHLVTVTGGPGIGKTRLVADFLERAGSRATVLSGRCLSYGRGITYFPLAQILRDGAGLSGTESPEVTRHTVADVFAGLDAADRLAEVLLPLLGAGGEPSSAEDTHEAFTRFLERVALRRPVVVQVDDLHWAEPPLLDLLDLVRQETADLPLLLVGQSRPELLEHRPSWGQGATNAVTIGLEPFDLDDVRASLGALLGDGVPATVEEAVTQWSGGNPLFVEEIVTHLRETGVLVPDGDGWAVTGELESAGVPATVSALLEARLERLPADERAVLEAISVVGLEMTGSEAAALAGDDAGRVLPLLARRDLLRRVRGSSEDTWSFRHVLIRDAAYDALPKAERSRLHSAFADHLAGDDGGLVGGERPALVAHHRLQAARYAAQLAATAPATVALADAAADAVATASDLVLCQDQDSAGELLRDALALPVGRERREHLLLSLLVLLESVYRHDQVVDVLEGLAEVLQDADPEGLERRSLEMSRLAATLHRADHPDPSLLRVSAEQVRAESLEVGDHLRAQLALIALTSIHTMDAQWEPVLQLVRGHVGTGGGFDEFVRSWESAALFHGPRHLSEMLASARAAAAAALTTPQRAERGMGVMVAAVALGDPEGAAALDECDLGELRTVLAPMSYGTLVSQVLEFAGRLPESLVVLGELVDHMVEAEEMTLASTYLALHALQADECGHDLAAVAAEVEQAAAWTSPYDVISTALVAAGRSLVALRQGRVQDAVAALAASLSAVDRSDQVMERANLRRLLAEVPRTLGDVGEERRLLAEALDLYERKGIVTWRRELRERLDELS